MKNQNSTYRSFKAAWFNGLPACAVELGKLCLKDYPKDGYAWLLYGVALTDVARYEESRRAFNQAIKYSSPQNLHHVYYQIGRLYDQRGDLRRAAEWFKKSIQLQPKTATYHILLGSVLARQGNLKDAEKCHRKATRCNDGAIDEAYLNLGLVLRAQGRYKEATKCFKKAIEIDPKYKIAKDAMRDMIKLFEL